MKHTSLVSIDSSDSSIKVLQLDAKGVVVAYGNMQIPAGVIQKGKIVDGEAFRTHLRSILSHTVPNALHPEEGTLRSVVCVPESKLFTHYMEIPESVVDADVNAYIYDDAKRSIPFDLRDMYWDSHVLKRNGKRTGTFVCVEKLDLDNYVEALTAAGVRPAFVASELFSLGRALSSDTEKSYMIVDIGGHSTTIGVFGPEAIPHVSVKLASAGEQFTKELMIRHKMSESDARTQKREYGLDPKHAKTGIPETIAHCLKEVVAEIIAAREFYEKRTGEKIEELILAGGSALMPYIDTYLEKETGIKTSIADPFAKIQNPEIFDKDTPRLLYATVIGLALLAVSDARTHINLLTQYEYRNTDIRSRLHRMRDVRSLDDFRLVLARLVQKFARYSDPGDVLDDAEQSETKPTWNKKLVLTVVFFVVSLVFLSFVVMHYAV